MWKGYVCTAPLLCTAPVLCLTHGSALAAPAAHPRFLTWPRDMPCIVWHLGLYGRSARGRPNMPHALARLTVAQWRLQVAKEAHVSGNAVGKAVLVELSSPSKAAETVMCVLRAPDHIELDRIAAATGFATARVLSEPEVQVRPPPAPPHPGVHVLKHGLLHH